MNLIEAVDQAVARFEASQQAQRGLPTAARPVLANVSPEPEAPAQSLNNPSVRRPSQAQFPDVLGRPGAINGRPGTSKEQLQHQQHQQQQQQQQQHQQQPQPPRPTSALGSSHPHILSLNQLEVPNNSLVRSEPGFAVVSVASVEESSPESFERQETSPDSVQSENLVPLKALVRRSRNLSLFQDSLDIPAYNPLDFYADVRYIPIQVQRGVFQILQSNPALRTPNLFQSHTLLSHGAVSHTWSLLPLSEAPSSTTSMVVRPISVLQTYGKGIPLSDTVIRDYSYAWRAQSVHLRHYSDSWGLSGSHAAFQVCKDYVFEWKLVEFPLGSGTNELYLWRRNVEEGSITPAARVCDTSPIKNPYDNSDLWNVEVDVDKIAPHIAILTAFTIKMLHSKFHSWFAPKEMEVPLPMPLVNFAFQDDGHVYQRLGKFYGDWEDSRMRNNNRIASTDAAGGSANPAAGAPADASITRVQVFQWSYIEQFLLPQKAVELMNVEANNTLEAVRAKYGIQ